MTYFVFNRGGEKKIKEEMKRKREEWLGEYLQKERARNDYHAEAYRDSREDILKSEENVTTRGLVLFEQVIAPTLLFREMMPKFLLSSILLSEVVESGVLSLIRRFYLSLHKEDFDRLPIPENLERIFSQCYSFGSIGRRKDMELHQKVLSIECVKCEEKTFFLHNETKLLKNLYQLETTHDEQSRMILRSRYPIGFCTQKRQFLCYDCDPVSRCFQCTLTMSKSALSLDHKYLQCGMKQIPQCQYEHEDNRIASFGGLYKCCVCEKFSCVTCCLEIPTTSQRICTHCVNDLCYYRGVVFDNEQFLTTLFQLHYSYTIEEEHENEEELENFDSSVFIKFARTEAKRIIKDPQEFLQFLLHVDEM